MLVDKDISLTPKCRTVYNNENKVNEICSYPQDKVMKVCVSTAV